MGTTVSGLAHTFEGLLSFLLGEFAECQEWLAQEQHQLTMIVIGNIVVIGGLIAAFFLYTMYVQRNGKPVTAAKAKGKKIQ